MLIGLLLSILAPLAAWLIQLAISRKREFLADASGALLTRYPEGLAKALEKISVDPGVPTASRATAHLYIESPFTGRKLSSFFMTHPPVEERVRVLRDMDLSRG
jgi:heat shock protein HtpX